jgi:hypothetical protein
MRPSARLDDLAHAVLDAVAGYYDSEGYDLPERRQVTAGMPAWDCALVAVWCDRTGPHSGDVTRTDLTPLMADPFGGTLRFAHMAVTICRCHPTIDSAGDTLILPTVAEEEASALAVHSDEVLVVNAVRDAAKAGTLPSLNSWAVADWRIIGPAGGFVASEHRLVIGTDWGPSGS